jgi:hypothetical protein
MQQLSPPLLLVVVVGAAAAAAASSLPARIVVADNATNTERWAAAKLADILMLSVTGVGGDPKDHDGPGGTAAAGAPQIAVGYGAAVALGMHASDLDALGDDSFLVSTKTARGVPAGSVAIASSAHSPRGAMNGAFAFLRTLDFEFFAVNVTRMPSPPPSVLPELDTLYSPTYVYRDLCMGWISQELNRRHLEKTNNCSAIAKADNWSGGDCQGESIWRPGTNMSAALGLNGMFSFAPVGGYVSPNDPPGFVATAYNLLTPNLDADSLDCGGPGTHEPHPQNTPCPAVFRQHPDWFTCGDPAVPCTAITVNRTYNSQPCWSAPGVQETMTQNILKILRADPTIKIISVSNMDGGAFAPCPLDIPAAVKENATGAANFYAVKNIAAAVFKEFPHAKIETLAYGGAFQPPRHLKFADNVIVRIAGFGVGSVSIHHPQNAVQLAVVQGWVKAAKTVFIWNGVNNGQILVRLSISMVCFVGLRKWLTNTDQY